MILTNSNAAKIGGSNAGTWTIGTLTGVPGGTTATYNSTNSTLSVTVP
jgi:hypothetical protein